MSNELFTLNGKRKYLSSQELDGFIATANQHERPEVRTLCLVLAHTGCRLSEALELTVQSIDLPEKAIVFRTLKQRDKIRYRSVSIPDNVLDALEIVHRLRKNQKTKAKDKPIWQWGRTQSWKHVKAVFERAGVEGLQASPKGLRHGFAVRAIDKNQKPSSGAAMAGTPVTGNYCNLYGCHRCRRKESCR